MRTKLLTLLFSIFSLALYAQQETETLPSKYLYADATVQISSDFVGSLSLGHSWGLGQKKKFVLGTGLRYSFFQGKDNKEFYSAPPEYYGKSDKQDTLTIASPSQSNIVLYISLSYRIKSKFEVGMNIDAVGYTFGADKDAVYTGNGSSQPTTASSGNASLLLIGANDTGMLSSEFYVQYHFNKKWSAKLGFAHTFTEFQTPTELQAGNKRFRGVSDGLVIGARYNIK
ncbi:hypothetical protein [Flammeovirga agarivorans]|uniref:Outer membrane protein beta-barrel domain-containing protein n=1 Tax=Flammeovirga agarivorans TaxID=2726742 RepID=A0A7X8XX83_9BACT|nr:hypothetical protein [Flammeovirga agarivorans]NLR93002.1 hypothetical protein [Flammeovirga agarivorans]